MDSWHLKPRCSVRIDAKPVLRIICVDFLSIATVKITLIKRELEDISGYPECSITFNGQLRNAIHSLYTSNVCSMRAHAMKPKAQCSGRRRDCIGYNNYCSVISLDFGVGISPINLAKLNKVMNRPIMACPMTSE